MLRGEMSKKMFHDMLRMSQATQRTLTTFKLSLSAGSKSIKLQWVSQIEFLYLMLVESIMLNNEDFLSQAAKKC